MAAGGYVQFTKKYWLWQAQGSYKMIKKHNGSRWEMLMYWYLFKWAGYEDD
jgi:hypothetical protein